MLSCADEHKVGAALMKGKTLVGVGWNSTKTHPKSCTRYNGHHAEFACLIGPSKYAIVGATIFVARITRGGNLGISKPCDKCEEFLRAAGVRCAYYYNRNGEVEKMRL